MVRLASQIPSVSYDGRVARLTSRLTFSDYSGPKDRLGVADRVDDIQTMN